MDRIRTVEHRGVPVMIVDYDDLRDPAAVIDLIESSAREIQSRPPRSQRVLMRVANVHFNPAVVAALKDAGLKNQPHLAAVAVVGLTGLTRVVHRAMMKLMRQEIPAFDAEPEALDWLAARA